MRTNLLLAAFFTLWIGTALYVGGCSQSAVVVAVDASMVVDLAVTGDASAVFIGDGGAFPGWPCIPDAGNVCSGPSMLPPDAVNVSSYCDRSGTCCQRYEQSANQFHPLRVCVNCSGSWECAIQRPYPPGFDCRPSPYDEDCFHNFVADGGYGGQNRCDTSGYCGRDGGICRESYYVIPDGGHFINDDFVYCLNCGSGFACRPCEKLGTSVTDTVQCCSLYVVSQQDRRCCIGPNNPCSVDSECCDANSGGTCYKGKCQ